MNIKVIIGILIIVIIAVGLATSFFTIDETEQAIVTQLGKPIRDVNQSGLHFKIPLIQKVRSFEARVLEYDADARKITTKTI